MFGERFKGLDNAENMVHKRYNISYLFIRIHATCTWLFSNKPSHTDISANSDKVIEIFR